MMGECLQCHGPSFAMAGLHRKQGDEGRLLTAYMAQQLLSDLWRFCTSSVKLSAESASWGGRTIRT